MNLIRYFGGEAQWCFASVLQNGRPVTGQDVQPGNEGIGPLAGDTVNAMYGLDAGVTAHFGSHRNAAGDRFSLQIYGSKGVIEILFGPLPAVHILQDSRWSPGRSGKRWVPVSSIGMGKEEPLEDDSLHAGNLLACRDLIAAIEEDRQPECSVYEARNTVEMIAAVFESHRQGRPVTIPLENRKNPLASLLPG
jgi:predicted dehydrogenase